MFLGMHDQTHYNSRITLVTAQIRSYVHRVLLGEADTVVSFRACRRLGDFHMGAMNNSVPNTANASLPTFNLSQLFHKRFAIGAAISGFGRTMFEFTLKSQQVSS
jgi:hypothetical protein